MMLLNPKVKCRQLLRDFRTIFYDNRTNKISLFDIISFFVCPTIIGITIPVGFDFYFSKDVINTLLTIFSILFTFLFGITSLLATTANSEDSTKATITKEAFTAASFAMLISLISLVLAIVYQVLLEKISVIPWFQALTGVLLALSSHMIMLFFMLIKRTYVASTTK